MTTTGKAFVIFGSLCLTAAAMLSAYGFHGLVNSVTPEQLGSWNWAIRMQTYHSLGLIVIAILGTQLGWSLPLRIAGGLFILGIILFSGSIYLETLGAPESIGEVAPAGGSSFMLGWILVAAGVWRAGPQR